MVNCRGSGCARLSRFWCRGLAGLSCPEATARPRVHAPCGDGRYTPGGLDTGVGAQGSPDGGTGGPRAPGIVSGGLFLLVPRHAGRPGEGAGGSGTEMGEGSALG